MFTKLASILALCVGASVFALATPENFKVFKEHYKLKKGSKLLKAQCSICHTVAPAHNAYGKDVLKQMQADGTDTLTDQVLIEIESKDSDGDGFTNIQEIKAGTLPGDPKSHPAKRKPKGKAAVATTHSPGEAVDAPAVAALVPGDLPISNIPVALVSVAGILGLCVWPRRPNRRT